MRPWDDRVRTMARLRSLCDFSSDSPRSKSRVVGDGSRSGTPGRNVADIRRSAGDQGPGGHRDDDARHQQGRAGLVQLLDLEGVDLQILDPDGAPGRGNLA